jgi:hypothetical protein
LISGLLELPGRVGLFDRQWSRKHRNPRGVRQSGPLETTAGKACKPENCSGVPRTARHRRRTGPGWECEMHGSRRTQARS